MKKVLCPDCNKPLDEFCHPTLVTKGRYGCRCQKCYEILKKEICNRCFKKGGKEFEAPQDYRKVPYSHEKRRTPKIPWVFLKGPDTSQPDGLTVRQREKKH